MTSRIRNQSVLVAGGAGFLGSHLCDRLLAEGARVLCIDNLQTACVGDVVATLKAQGRQHALVVERTPDRGQILRGMFSVSQINRQLNTQLEVEGVASTFAELGVQLGR